MSGSTPTDVLTLTTDPADALAIIGDSVRVARDDFAGPGGWSTGIRDLLKRLGIVEVGLEWDAAACATRIANGHTGTLRADVAAYPIGPFLGRTCLYIGSPPCQTFSKAGKGEGRRYLELLCWAVRAILIGTATYEEAMVRLEEAGALDDKDGNPDPRNGLILIPARTIRVLLDHDGQGPTDLEAVALEQVPGALPVFEVYAAALRELGFSAVCTVINAADYGVPQTRERAFVLASRVRKVTVPEPTHAKGGEPLTLFGPGRLPWFPMAAALGWGAPADVAYGDHPGAWAATRPATTIAGDPRLAPPIHHDHRGMHGTGTLDSAAVRAWLEERLNAGTVADAAWAEARPATTVVGSFAPDVIAAPGYRRKGDPPRQYTPGSLRITEAEGARLQGFPADYRWEGRTKGKRWEQIGNVVCPPVARRVVAEVLGIRDVEPLPWHAYAFEVDEDAA